MQDFKTDLIKLFLKTNSFKHDPVKKFRLSSGIESEFYIDCKTLMGDPRARNLIARYAFDKIGHLHFDCIGGLELGAIAIGTAIADYALAHAAKEWSTFVVRKQAKAYGLGKRIEGILQNEALIVDDVLTSGGSILQAVEAVRQAGLIVKHALVIVDRQEQQGKKNLESQGVELLSLLTVNDFQTVENPTVNLLAGSDGC